MFFKQVAKLTLHNNVLGYRFKSHEGFYLDLSKTEANKLSNSELNTLYNDGNKSITLDSFRSDELREAELYETDVNGDILFVTKEELTYSKCKDGYYLWSMQIGTYTVFCMSYATKEEIFRKKKDCEALRRDVSKTQSFCGYSVINIGDVKLNYVQGDASFNIRLDSHLDEYASMELADSIMNILRRKYEKDVSVLAGEKGYFTIVL